MIACRFVILTFFLSCFNNLIGQISIENFTRIKYGGGSQNWAFQQDSEGHIFVANNEGLLVFSGTKWELFPIPNQTIVRSISFGNDGRLYIGGQDEIGFFSPGVSGKLVYESLLKHIDKDDRQFADVWSIVPFGKDVFFRSSTRLFRLHDNAITTYRTSSQWDFLGIHTNLLLAHEKGHGLLVFRNEEWKEFIKEANLPNGFAITSICPIKNQSLLTTTSNGVFMLTGNQLVSFKLSGQGVTNSQSFTSVQHLTDNRILLGTYDHGLYIADSLGIIKKIVSINEGLNSNNIKCIFIDYYNNIWLGLDDGISFLDLTSPVQPFNPKAFNGAAGYAAVNFNNRLYFALANGIYKMPYDKSQNLEAAVANIEKIADGLSWQLSIVQNHLFAGRDDGFFEVTEKGLVPVDKSTGYWTFKSLSSANEPFLFAAGDYLGVSFFRYENNSYKKEADLRYLNTSARFIEYDSVAKVLWMSHPYRGVYRVSMPGNIVRLFTQSEGLPSSLNNHVFKINNQILVATIKGVYSYNATEKRFVVYEPYDTIFKGKSLRYLQQDDIGNLWFVHEKTPGFLNNATRSVIYFPELERKILSGFEHIFPVDKNNVLIGSEQGFFVVNPEKYFQSQNKPFVFIQNVISKNKSDSVLYAGFGGNTTKPVRLFHKWNSFHFEFSSPYTTRAGHMQYSCRLSGFEKEWSEWSEKTEKEYTNIPAGQYVFEVKARNNLNEQSAIAVFSFEILPPWYNSVWARILYLLLIGGLLYSLYKLQEKALHKQQEKKMLEDRKKSEEKQRMLAYQHQLELEKSEKKLIQLENEKLESELASTAMNLVQKKEFILKIKDEINRIKKSGKDNIDSVELKKILRSLTDEEKLDEEWERFSIHFNMVHGNFLTTLKNVYPELKAHELKLCAYLRLNLSSKEIARLMSISVRGVEISRYRLRKKLHIPAKEDLLQFLLNMENANKKDSLQNKSKV